MMNRLFKDGLITTLLGVMIFILAAVLYSIGKPMEEVAILAGWGLMFLRAKDSLIGLDTNKDANRENH
jgi:hypothetical protein